MKPPSDRTFSAIAPEPLWARAHEKACMRGEEGYVDPETGYFVFTRLGLLNRGYCCGSGCRHCPYVKAETRSKA